MSAPRLGTDPDLAARVRCALDLLTPGLARAATRMWQAADADPARVYRAWLRAQYQAVQATVPLLTEAALLCRARQLGGDRGPDGDDESCERLAAYFEHQAREESGHDRWVVADYAATGADPRELDASTPHAAVARLVGAQYYWIRHVHPAALLGHIAVLEHLPPSAQAAASLSARTKLPAHAFRTITAHADFDAAHTAELDALLAELPLSAGRQHLVLVSLAATAEAVLDVTRAVASDARTPHPHSRPLRDGAPDD